MLFRCFRSDAMQAPESGRAPRERAERAEGRESGKRCAYGGEGQLKTKTEPQQGQVRATTVNLHACSADNQSQSSYVFVVK
jgi:hypothetical protein